MCLAVPAQLVEQRGQCGVVDLHGNRLPVNTVMTPNARSGDWLLVHAGFSIEQLDPQEASETWSLIKDLQEAASRHADAPDAKDDPVEDRSIV
jgi:hydrogenase expression/formation protein HypC